MAAESWFGCGLGIGTSQNCKQARHLDELRGLEDCGLFQITGRDMKRKEKESPNGGQGDGIRKLILEEANFRLCQIIHL